MIYKSMASVALMVVASVSLSVRGPCDLKTIEAGFFCEDCVATLASSSLVSGVTFYVCPDCEARYKKAGECSDCEQSLEKKVSGKNVCPTCLVAPAAADLCVKTYFVCPKCQTTAAKAQSCTACEVALEKKISRAVVTYECSECMGSSHKPGKCTDEECERSGKPLDVKSCSESGTAPHDTAKPS